MKDGIDYKLYAKPEYPADMMNLIRHAMATGFNVRLHFVRDDVSIEVNTENK